MIAYIRLLQRPALLVVLVLFVQLAARADAEENANTNRNALHANPKSKSNVLFIAIDDLKPELGCYGSTEVLSPSIDRLASRSTVFLNAHCQFPVCGGSRASLMTGLRPEATGVMDLKTKMRAKNPNVITIAQMFADQGYTTAGVGKIYDPRCVDNKKDNDKPSWTMPFTPFEYSKFNKKPTDQYALSAEDDADHLVDGWSRSKAVELIQQLAVEKKPFFLAVGFKKPHLPFVAPKKYWDMIDPATIKLAEHQTGIKNPSGYSVHNSPEFRNYGGVPKNGLIPQDVQRRAIHGYRACVSYIDDQVGQVLEEVDKQGLTDNTIVVLWGDHGFHLGDHGMWGKHTTLEQATRVPLMIRMPATAAATNSMPVELCDLLPTLGEAAGLEVPPCDGRSLLPLIGVNEKQASNRQLSPRKGALTVFKSRGALGYSFRTRQYRYTQWINKKAKVVATELFDYNVDPLEKENLTGQEAYALIEAKLAEQLHQHSQGCDRLKESASATTTKK